MTTTDARAFIDTNVLLRALNRQLPLHTEANALLDRARHDELELWISRQVIREYLVQLTRPGFLLAPVSIDEALQHLDILQKLCLVADETQDVTDQLRILLRRFPTRGKQVHDANIVATMLALNIQVLLTQNVDDMKRFTPLIEIWPLSTIAP